MNEDDAFYFELGRFKTKQKMAIFLFKRSLHSDYFSVLTNNTTIRALIVYL